MIRLPDFQLAAAAAAWGLPYRRLLTAVDSLDKVIEAKIIEMAIEKRIESEEAIASQIGYFVAKALAG